MQQLELSAQNAGPLQLKLSRILCIVIRASFGMKGKDILRFVDEKQAWIGKRLQIARTRRAETEPLFQRKKSALWRELL